MSKLIARTERAGRYPFITWMARACVVLLLSAAFLTGCSMKKMAVNQVGNALAGGGATISSDDDPELIRAAAPFSLKLMESLLAESPKHQPLLLSTASSFTQFAYAFVQMDADEIEEDDYEEAERMRARARKLYLRARDYGLRGLDARHRDFKRQLHTDAGLAVERTRKRDLPLLYWTATSWAAAISLSKDQPDMIAELPMVEALIDRALALDEAYGEGAIHSFLITFEMSRPEGEGDAVERARRHFARAVDLSGGVQAGTYVALAESVAVQEQNVAEFRSLLDQALAIDVDTRPEWRLENLMMQRRARWLLERTEYLFLLPEDNDAST